MITETIEAILSDIDKKLQEGKVDAQDYEKAAKKLFSYKKELQEKLEFATTIKNDDKDLLKIHHSLIGENISNLIDSLRNKGFAYKQNNKPLYEAFDKAGHRLLEQTRAAKKDDVFYGILRIFISTKQEFPKELVEAFKPIYSEEMFKVLIFSFLSGIIGNEKQVKNN